MSRSNRSTYLHKLGSFNSATLEKNKYSVMLCPRLAVIQLQTVSADAIVAVRYAFWQYFWFRI